MKQFCFWSKQQFFFVQSKFFVCWKHVLLLFKELLGPRCFLVSVPSTVGLPPPSTPLPCYLRFDTATAMQEAEERGSRAVFQHPGLRAPSRPVLGSVVQRSLGGLRGCAAGFLQAPRLAGEVWCAKGDWMPFTIGGTVPIFGGNISD